MAEALGSISGNRLVLYLQPGLCRLPGGYNSDKSMVLEGYLNNSENQKWLINNKGNIKTVKGTIYIYEKGYEPPISLPK